MQPQSVSKLIMLLQSEDESLAQSELWRRYYVDIAQRVSRRLERRFCAAADEEDIALSTMDSFFRGMQEGRFPNLRRREELWNLLLTIAYRKVLKHRKAAATATRGGGAVQHLASLQADFADRSTGFEFVDVNPSEEEIAMMVEEITEDLGDPVLRTIAVRRLQGFTDKEIARQLGVTERTVIRKRQRIQAIWQSE